MNYAQSSMIGDVGERRVADSLRMEAPRLGYQLLNNVLLIDDQTTAQIDHLIIDRFGILAVETKNYHALVKGKSDDKHWTACYSGKAKKRERFLNPLRQNDRHREMLQRVLQAYGQRLPAEYVQSLVVFSGGNLAHLDVDDFDALRVVPNREVVDYLDARCMDFQPNPGALDAQQVTDLVSLLQSVNKSQDRNVVELHGENVSRASQRFGGFGRRPAPSHPASASLYGSHVPYNQSGRYPDGSHHGASRPPSRRRERALVSLLLSLLGFLFLLWIVYAGGIYMITDLSSKAVALIPSASTPAVSPATPAVSQQLAVSYDTPLALSRLKESAPRTYKNLTNASSPVLSTADGLPTYTWRYVDKSASNAVSVHEISITLDGSGQIVGVAGQ